MTPTIKFTTAFMLGCAIFLGIAHQIAVSNEQGQLVKSQPSEAERAKQRKGKGTRHTKRAPLPSAANWHLLWFWPLSEGEPGRRVIEKATLSLCGSVTEERIEIAIDDREILDQLQLATHMPLPLRYAFPDDGTCGGGFGSIGPFGILKVSATDGDFIIGMTPAGFVLDDTKANCNNTFFSWALARRLEEIQFKKTGKHFPDDIFKELSGIACLEDQGWKSGKDPRARIQPPSANTSARDKQGTQEATINGPGAKRRPGTIW